MPSYQTMQAKHDGWAEAELLVVSLPACLYIHQGLCIAASQYRCECSVIQAAIRALIDGIESRFLDMRRACESVERTVVSLVSASKHAPAYGNSCEEALPRCRHIAKISRFGCSIL
jgi:hypothetical protein